MFAARLHGGPHDGKTLRFAELVDPLRVIDPSRVTLDTFWPHEALVEYRLTHVFAERGVAFYDFAGE